MVNNVFIDEDELNRKYTEREISALDYVKHHSQEMLDDYNRYLDINGLEDNEESAESFLSDDEDEVIVNVPLEDADVEVGESTVNPTSIDIFKKWTRNNLRLEMLLGSDDAVNVSLWRYNNPDSISISLCAEQCNIDETEVKEWWHTIDFVVGSLGGSNFSMVNPTFANMQSIIQDAVTAAFIQE